MEVLDRHQLLELQALGYKPGKMAHWYYEAETPLDAAYALLKGFIMRYGTEQLNKL